jgi:hypothetical protein
MFTASRVYNEEVSSDYVSMRCTHTISFAGLKYYLEVNNSKCITDIKRCSMAPDKLTVLPSYGHRNASTVGPYPRIHMVSSYQLQKILHKHAEKTFTKVT